MKNAFAPILLIALAIALFFLYTSPTLDEVGVVKAEKARYDEALNSARELQSLRDDLLAQYNTFPTEDLVRVERMLPESIDNVRLIIEVNEIAEDHGLDISGFSFSDDLKLRGEGINSRSNTAKAHGTLTFDFTVNATYTEFIDFVRDLEENLRIMDIRQVSFSSPGFGRSDYALTIDTYWQE